MDRSRTDLRPPPEAIQVGSIPDRSQKGANVHIQLVLRPDRPEIDLAPKCERGLRKLICQDCRTD